MPLPGRAGPAGREPVALLRRLYPAEHPVGRFGAPDGTSVGALDPGCPGRPALSRAGRRRSSPPQGPGRCPGSRPGCASRTAARGTASRPTPRCASTCSRRRTRSTTRSRPAPRPSWPASSATCGSRSCSTRSSPPRPASSTWPTCRPPSRPRSCAVIRTSSVTPWPGPHPTSTASGSGSRPTSERPRADEAGTRGARPRARSTASARRCRRWRPARRCRSGPRTSGYDWPSIEGVLDKVIEETDELRAAADDVEWAEEFGDLLFVLVNVARRRGIEAEAAVRAANAKFRRRFASVERRRRRPGRRAARPGLRRARRAVGCRQG